MKTAFVTIPIVSFSNGVLVRSGQDLYCECPHIAVYSLTSIVRKHGFDVTIIDYVASDNEINVNMINCLDEYDIILLSSNSTNWPLCSLIIEWIKQKYPEKILILGGIHGSIFGNDVIRRTKVDYIVRGEGEKIIIPLLNAIITRKPVDHIPNLIYKNNNGEITCSEMLPLLSQVELDELDEPSYDLVPKDVYSAIPVQSSRGCTGNCIFCAIPEKNSWRPISSKCFITKISSMLKFSDRFKYNVVQIVDDCFTIDHKRVSNILDSLDELGLKLLFTYDARVIDFLDEHLVERIEPYTNSCLVGAESFLARSISFIKKPVNKKIIEKSAQIAQKLGLSNRVKYSFIIGFPWETYRDILENLSQVFELVSKYNVGVMIQWHLIIPGSREWFELFSIGKVKIEDIDEPGYIFGLKNERVANNLNFDEKMRITEKIFQLKELMSSLGISENNIEFSLPVQAEADRNLFKEWIDSKKSRASTIFSSI